jgi:hypothetical protein
MKRKVRPDRTICHVAVDGHHRWQDPPRRLPMEQLSIDVAQCSACGAFLWKPSGHIDPGLGSPEAGVR